MVLKIFTTVVVLVAIAVGVLALALPRDEIVRLVVFREFFDVCLPVLAFGALVKYLCTCSMKKGCCCNKGSCDTSTKVCH